MKRLSMRKIEEILRLKWAKGLSNRQIARAWGVGYPQLPSTCAGPRRRGWPGPHCHLASAVCRAGWGGQAAGQCAVAIPSPRSATTSRRRTSSSLSINAGSLFS